MHIVHSKRIIKDYEPLSQGEIQTSHLHDGLRLLARLITKAILDSHHDNTTKNNEETSSLEETNLDV